MSLRLEMLQVARLAHKQLHQVQNLVIDFVESQINSDGGFQDRSGTSDLYYTVFGLDSLIALQSNVPKKTADYLKKFGNGEGLDFIHLCCLARCWGALSILPENHLQILEKIELYRSQDGGYNITLNSKNGSVYGCFLALGAYQDLRQKPSNISNLLVCVESLQAKDGGYANEIGMKFGNTPATAAATIIQKKIGVCDTALATQWLLGQCLESGGFVASPQTPIPDLLSTATALHALASIEADFSIIVEPCIDFIDSLWTNTGSFYGNWTEQHLDCEYTFYGLLALGHLSV